MVYAGGNISCCNPQQQHQVERASCQQMNNTKLHDRMGCSHYGAGTMSMLILPAL